MNTPDPASGPSVPDPDEIAAFADELLDRRRFDQASQVLGEALRAHPDHAGLLYEAARCELLQDREDAARQTLAHLLGRDPAHRPARLLLALLEQAAGRLPQAEQLFIGLLRDAPQEPVYYAYYARVMLRALDFEKASRLADQALRLAPELDVALHTRALCDIAEGRKGHDSPAMIRLLVQQPDDAYTLRLVVLALVHAKRTREAQRLAQDLLRAQPDDPNLLELVVALRADNHWSMLPLWPMRRWGWAGSIGLWLGMLVVVRVLGQVAPAYAGAFAVAWIALVVYSWAWPPLFNRLVKPK